MSATSTVEPPIHRTAPRGRDPKVVFVVIVGLPIRSVDHTTMPVLDGLRADCRLAAPALSVLTSSSRPNLATFTTGVDPCVHGVTTADGIGWSATLGLVPTIFDACAAKDRDARAMVGGDELIPLLGAARNAMDRSGQSPVAAALRGIEESADFVMLQLTGPDPAARRFGPTSPDALAAYRLADQAVGQVVDALHPRWSDYVLIVVSDHDQLVVENPHPIDLTHSMHRIASIIGEQPGVVVDGDAALVTVPEHTDRSVFDELVEIEGRLQLSATEHLVWAPKGRVLSLGDASPTSARAVHGGPYTRSQVAVVSGGHHTVPELRHSLGRRPVRAADWAPTVAALLEVPLPTATGFPLIAPGAMRERRASARRARGRDTAS